jgi:prephenate dehydrogenase
MSNVSIIGTGSMAGIIGARAVEGGNTVEVIGRDAAKVEALAERIGGVAGGGIGTAPVGDIVIRAVPCRTPTPHRSCVSSATRCRAR